jgi:phage baseplate assembly protein W
MTIFQDIDISFTSNPSTGDILKRFDVQAATFALKNVMLTSPGQNFGDFKYGIGLNEMQFEIMTPALSGFIKKKILEQIAIYVPEIKVVNLSVIDDNAGTFSVVLLYYIIGNPQNVQTYSLTLNKNS